MKNIIGDIIGALSIFALGYFLLWALPALFG